MQRLKQESAGQLFRVRALSFVEPCLLEIPMYVPVGHTRWLPYELGPFLYSQAQATYSCYQTGSFTPSLGPPSRLSEVLAGLYVVELS